MRLLILFQIYFHILLQQTVKPTTSSFVVCSSITIQGPTNLNRLNKIKNCNIVVGHVRILNARFDEDLTSTPMKWSNQTQQQRWLSNGITSPREDLFVFNNLVEITDYLLIFQAQNLNSLERLFPRLTLIRGDHLFKNHALIIFLTNSLLQINLKSLIQIQKGSILLSRLYHTCYINTIDWDYLLIDKTIKTQPKPTITLINNECYTQICQQKCRQPVANNTTTTTTAAKTSTPTPTQSTKQENLNCWNEKNCQLKCPSECLLNCNLNEPSKCCQNKLCMYCWNETSCVTCSRYRDLRTGKCVDQCPANTLVYESHSCVKYEDCSRDTSTSLIKSYHIFNETSCVRECPNGYRTQLVQRILPGTNHNRKLNFSQCVQCDDYICKKDCPYSFSLKSNTDLDSIKNCFRVKSLHIELRANITQQLLTDSLKYLEIIDESLVIVRNRHLATLNFFKSLRLINGFKLYEKKFALFVHTNDILRELWPYDKTQFRIRNGTVKFFENAELCYENIETFLQICKINFTDAEISFNFNGYRRLTCSNRTIELKFDLEPETIIVSWNITISDLRRLKGFIVSYMDVPDDYTIDQNNVDFMHSTKLRTSSFEYESNEWNYLYVQYSDDGGGGGSSGGGDEVKVSIESSRTARAKLDVEPFTRYAIYVKVDLTTDSEWDNKHYYSSFGLDRVISDINYVYSMPAQPDRIESISYELLTFSQAIIKWNPPKRPNGIIDFYFMAYTRLTDMEQFPNDADSCQFAPLNKYTDQYLIRSDYQLELTTATTTTTTTTTPTRSTNDSLKSLNLDKKETCLFTTDNYEGQMKRKKLKDNEKNDLISVEDEIYNLVLRPAKIKSTTTSSNLISSTVKIDNSKQSESNSNNAKHNLNKDLPIDGQLSIDNTESTEADSKHRLNSTIIFNEFYNLKQNLLKIIRRDLFVQEDEPFVTVQTSNETLNATMFNLTSFGRYIVAVIACQNFSQELTKYAANSFNKKKQNRNLLIDYLSLFPIETYCSKANLITFRSLPDERLDQVTQTWLTLDSGIWYFKWTKPANPNGFIYKYNLRFIDSTLNKTQGPLCYASLENLKVALNQFLLTEGHEYLIQVQAVSTAGPGPWSLPAVKYKVPSISQYYIKLISEITGGILLLLTLVSASYFILRKYNKSKERGYFSINSHYYYFRPDEWEVKREDLIIGERIGSGCFAEVHKGKLKLKNNDLVDCAIKFCGSDHQNRQRILKEANMMKSINTTHIVKLLGVVSKDNPAYLILEFMDKGDLKEYLKTFKTQTRETKEVISVQRFYRIAAEIADGMLWLSEHKYIHRDLAARNCLISKDDVIKIADLGLSKDIYQNPVYRDKCKSLLPIRWMSPESLIDGSSTTKSDVWSYGVVIWEMSTYGDNPYTGKENEEVIEFVKNGGRLELPSNSPTKFYTILNKCMINEDYKRINFKEIIDILDPDLTCDFKKASYYHNEFKKKQFKKKPQLVVNNNEKSELGLAHQHHHLHLDLHHHHEHEHDADQQDDRVGESIATNSNSTNKPSTNQLDSLIKMVDSSNYGDSDNYM